jgi:putative heme-binding domain-containing protein
LRSAVSQRAGDVESLAALLRRGIPGTEMPAFAPETIADQPLRGLAAHVLSFRSGSAPASARGGRGLELFRDKGKCVACHRVNGEGSAAGPDLSDIGGRRSTQWLRQAIVEPEAAIWDSFSDYRWTIAIPDNYLLVDLTTASGERVTGSRLNEDAFSIQIRDGSGRIRSFLKSQLANMKKEWGKSPMPSYRDILAPGEVDELVSWLSSLRGGRR